MRATARQIAGTVDGIVPQRTDRVHTGENWIQIAADTFCQYWSSDQQRCFLHESPAFGNVLNIVTAALIGVSIVFDVLVFIFVGDLELYGEEEIEDNNYRLIPMQTYPTNGNATIGQPANGLTQPLLFQQSNDQRQNSSPSTQPIYDHVTPYATIIPSNGSSNQSPPPSVPSKNVNLKYAQIEFPSTSNGQQQENLNFRLRTINDSESESDITTTASPSTTRAPLTLSSDRESDANVIRRMESSVSSLSGVHESSTSPPMRIKVNVDGSGGRQRRPLSPETDF